MRGHWVVRDPAPTHCCRPPHWHLWRRIKVGAVWECECGRRWKWMKNDFDWDTEWVLVKDIEPGSGREGERAGDRERWQRSIRSHGV